MTIRPAERRILDVLPTLLDVLALPSFRSAAVEVLVGDPAATTVRWVHSSEVYEMGGLLAGGELLLTTGLGLYGRTAAQLTAYVDLLADAGCAALAMEIGRSFFVVPPELVQAAQRRGMALLALRAVVPFERMTEDFHDLLVARQFAKRQSGEPIWQALLGTVVAGQGLAALLTTVSRLAGCAVEFRDLDDHVLARSTGPAAAPGADATAVDVRGVTDPLGRLLFRGQLTARRAAVAGRAALAVALEIGRHQDARVRTSPAQALVADLVAGAVSSAGDLAERMTLAGLALAPGEHVLVAAVDLDVRVAAADLLPAVRDAVAGPLGACVVGSIGHHVIVVTRGWPRPSVSRVRLRFDEVYAALVAGDGADSVRTIGVAMPVVDLADVGSAVASARDVVQILRRLGVRSGVHLARDIGVPRLLASAVDQTQMAAFVGEQLGALIAYDTQHSADLIRTLDAYLRSGCSKSHTSAMLGIRRQSLYGRLDRIERLLGVRVADPDQVMCLAVAMVAWRMRTGLDPQAAFDRHAVAAS